MDNWTLAAAAFPACTSTRLGGGAGGGLLKIKLRSWPTTLPRKSKIAPIAGSIEGQHPVEDETAHHAGQEIGRHEHQLAPSTGAAELPADMAKPAE